MGSHFHSNSKALWEESHSGEGVTHARILAPMATAESGVGMNALGNLAKVHWVKTMYNQGCQSILKFEVKINQIGDHKLMQNI